MRHRRANVTIAESHGRLQRHTIPDKAKLFEVVKQQGDSLLMVFTVQMDNQLVPGHLIDILTRLQ
ncbi:Uncharacterised protein [Klebsiella pneumoniae]|nr:Uncharacterised protein [Klebsiella pneumoniae]